ncbi:nuclear transport factor 2 family protein [Alkalibacillus silvisoli]|uniref:SnoaL-like domain-containing protein n=1 Tax=Alkalibacillus silvisoli TaxID=392823 RepID=A0ABN0ZKR6_9BACI
MNNPKKLFFHDFNKAFVTGDYDFVFENVTDHIIWTIVGEEQINGKDELKEKFNANNGTEHSINRVITHGIEAVVEGTYTNEDGKRYQFSEIYKLNKHKNGLIREITSYIIEIQSNV